MTTFLDGPAEGKRLMLKRAPFFLRVTEEKGAWDALDQLEDAPKPTERIHVYRVHGSVGRCHILRRPTGSGWFTIASYRFHPVQPTDAEVRDPARWPQWCRDHQYDA